jgi:hypothetical protein
MSQIEPGKRPGVQAVTIANIAQVLHVSTDDVLGLKVAEDGDAQEKTVSIKTVGSCSARGDDRIPHRSSRRSHSGVWASRAASLHLENTPHNEESSVPSNISGQLDIELRQIEGADCPQLLRQRRIVA